MVAKSVASNGIALPKRAGDVECSCDQEKEECKDGVCVCKEGRSGSDCSGG